MNQNIKAARLNAGMTQAELAEKSGVSRAVVNGLESGRLVVTTTETLLKIANALSVNVSDIFFS